MKQSCRWCELKTAPCMADNCDFKSLPYEEDAIVKRIGVEVGKIQEFKKRVSLLMGKEDAAKVMFEIMDRAKGIDIMVSALKKDFGMTEERAKEMVQGLAKQKLDAKKEFLKRKRGGRL